MFMSNKCIASEEKTHVFDSRHARDVLAALLSLLTTATSREDLLQAVCLLLVRSRAYRMAWIGLVRPEDTRVHPVAQAGFEDGYLSSVDITWDESPSGQGPTGTAIRSRRPVVMKDVARDPAYAPWRDEALARGYASSASVPLRFRKRVLGALNVYAAQADAFDEGEIALLEQIAQALSSTLYAFEEEERRHQAEKSLRHAYRAEHVARERAEALAHAAQVLATAANPEEVLNQVLILLEGLIPYDAANVMIVEQGRTRTIRSRGYDRFGAQDVVAGLRLVVSETPNLKRSVETRAPILIRDVRQIPEWRFVAGLDWIRAYAAVPLVADDHVLGFICVDSATPGVFTKAHARVLTDFAALVAAALHKARLIEDLRSSEESQRRLLTELERTMELTSRREAYLRTIAQIAQVLLATDDVFQVMPDVLARLGEVARVSRAYVFENRFDEEGRLLMSQRFEWSDAETPSEMNNALLQDLPYSEAAPRWRDVLSTGVPVMGLVKDFPQSEREMLESQGIVSVLVLPIFVQDRWWGFIGFDDCKRERDWEEVDRDMLEVVAALIGTALDRQATEHSLQRRLGEVTLLNRVVAAATAQLDPVAILQTLCRELASFFNLPQAAAGLLSPKRDAVVIVAEYRQPNRPSAIGVQLPLVNNPVTEKVIRMGIPVIVEDAWVDPRMATLHGEVKRRGTRALVVLPLVVRGEVIGTVGLDDLSPHPFAEEDIRLAQAAVAAAAQALANARLYESLQQALAQREAMIQNVSHELRTPLTVIGGYAELLLHKSLGPQTEEQEEATRHILENASRLGRLVRMLLALQTIDEPEPVALDVTAGHVVHAWQLRLGSDSPIRLHMEVDDQIPAVLGDEDMLKLLLDNLLDNAIKFSPQGGNVHVRVAREGDTVVLCVEDEGIGIPEEVQSHVFDAFFQVDSSTTRHFGGMGIGLTLIRRIVERHGGTISIHSRKGQGTRVDVCLPASA